MALFTKKPVTIEAVQVTAADWNGSSFDDPPFSEVPDWVLAAMAGDVLVPVTQDTDYAVWDVRTNHGVVRAEPGDWVIQQVDGEIYPCKDSVFQATYAPAKPAEHHKSYEGGGRGLTFGQAIEQLKAGDRIARDGWNGKSMWLSLSGPLHGRAIGAEAFWSANNAAWARHLGGVVTVLPCITMKTATGEILMGWTPNGLDVFAEDWCVVGGNDGA